MEMEILHVHAAVEPATSQISGVSRGSICKRTEPEEFDFAESERHSKIRTSSAKDGHSHGCSSVLLSSRISSKVSDEVVFEMKPASSSEHAKICSIFVVLGVGIFYFWDAAVNSMYACQTYMYPDYPDMTDTLTPYFDFYALLAAICVTILGPLRVSIVCGGMLGAAVVSILWGVVCTFVPNKPGVYSLRALMGFAGIFSKSTQCTVYAYSVCYHPGYAAWFSFGIGVSGIIAPIVWGLASQLFFSDDQAGSQKAIWFVMSCATVSCLACIPAVIYFANMEVVKSWSETAKQLAEYDAERGIGPSSYWQCFRKTIKWQWISSLCCFITYMIYPNIGPYGWNETVSQASYTSGSVQVTDCLGRYIPTLAAILPAVLLNESNTVIFNYSRLIFIPLTLAVMYCAPTTPVLGDLWFQAVLLVLLGLTGGYALTLAFIHLPTNLTQKRDRGRASSIATVLMTVGVVIGMTLCYFLNKLDKDSGVPSA